MVDSGAMFSVDEFDKGINKKKQRQQQKQQRVNLISASLFLAVVLLIGINYRKTGV